ncbi:hypothetical protein FKP32DRAFT_1679793 [Trametes sanguinea]|nr:hypothetical protein FKP32DRAFT_1679793 [Trametes sanguinea]
MNTPNPTCADESRDDEATTRRRSNHDYLPVATRACSPEKSRRGASALRKELDIPSEQIAQPESVLGLQSCACDSLTIKLNRANGRTLALEKSIRRYEEELADMSISHMAAVEASLGQSRAAEGRCAALQIESGSLRQSLHDAQADLHQWKARYELLKEHEGARTSSIESKVRYLEAENASLAAEVELLRERCGVLDDDLEDVTASLEIAKTDYLNLEWQMDEEVNRLQSENNDKDDILALTEQLSRSTSMTCDQGVQASPEAPVFTTLTGKVVLAVQAWWTVYRAYFDPMPSCVPSFVSYFLPFLVRFQRFCQGSVPAFMTWRDQVAFVQHSSWLLKKMRNVLRTVDGIWTSYVYAPPPGGAIDGVDC